MDKDAPIAPRCRFASYAAVIRNSDLFLSVGGRLLSGSIENSTRRGYACGLRKFNDFLSRATPGRFSPSFQTSSELRTLITQAGVIESFICFCFEDNITSGTTSNYIDGLKYFATDLEGTPYFPRERIILRLLDGFQKLGKRPEPPKLAIDVLLLRRLVQYVDVMGVGHDKALWKALFIVAFFGCFRVSEFLVSQDELKLLSFNRVRLAGDGIEFVLDKTKNNPSGPTQQVLFGPLPGDSVCPVLALRSYICTRHPSSGDSAFFIDSVGKAVTSNRFNLMLRKALQGLGILDTMLYSAKSFRVGAASGCYSLNLSNEDIQALGRWTSLAFLYYVRSGARAVRARSVQKKLAAVR